MELKDHLGKRDAIHLLELIHASLGCDREGMLGLFSKLGSLIQFDSMVCGLGEIGPDGMVIVHELINVSYPVDWLNLYMERNYLQIDPILRENYHRFHIQFWEDTYKAHVPPREFLSASNDFGLTNGYTHGVKSPRGSRGSLFSLAGTSVERSMRTELILDHIVPHFHQALVRLSQAAGEARHFIVSSREREVLAWLKEGKSNWDISVILGISERTVKFHIKNIMRKLNAVNRSHAVAIAIERGIVDI